MPVYPPGPFAAWNRGTPERRDGQVDAAGPAAGTFEPPGHSVRPAGSLLTTATITPDEFDTNHSLPAIKDPVLTKARAANAAADRGSAGGQRSASRGTATRAPAPPRRRAEASRGSGKSKRTKGSTKRQPVRLAIGAATVIIAAVAAILVITSLGKPGGNSGNGKPGQPRASTSPTSARPAGKWGYIGARQTDPVPLAVTELFPARFVTGGGVHYYLTTAKEGHNCHAVLIGTALQTAVRQAQCSQVLRASYMGRLVNAMATIGVFNLATSAGASAAAQHAGPAEFVADLPASTGVTSKLGQGSGIEEAVVKGHYLVLVWAENIDLTTPSTLSQRQRLTTFMQTLIKETINKGLSFRMVEGKPGPPA